MFNINRPIVKDYIDYIISRSNIWADKHIHKDNLSLYSNSIFEKYHLCNIWRELDKFSQEEIKRLNLIKNFKDKILLILLGRYTLSFSTTDILLNPNCTLKDVYKHWELCKKQNIEFVGNAIQLYPKKDSDRAKDVYLYRAKVLKNIDYFLNNFTEFDFDPYLLFEQLKDKLNCGPFRAYEMIISFTYCKEVSYNENDFQHVGPGSIENLKLISEIDIRNNEEACKVLRDLSKIVKEYIIKNVPEFFWIPKEYQGSINFKEQYKFTPRTLEDSFCEFRKYNNFLNNIGRRRKYNVNRVV